MSMIEMLPGTAPDPRMGLRCLRDFFEQDSPHIWLVWSSRNGLGISMDFQRFPYGFLKFPLISPKISNDISAISQVTYVT